MFLVDKKMIFPCLDWEKSQSKHLNTIRLAKNL